MKTRVKILVAAVFCGGMLFEAGAQVNVNANDINFRTTTTTNNYTDHYGDLRLFGTGGGPGNNALGIGGSGTWGWFSCNRLYVRKEATGASEIHGGLILHGDSRHSNSNGFIHPHPTDTANVVRYNSMESDEALTITRGNAKTVDGEATIKLPEHFSLVTSKKAPITVLVTPKGVPALLYTKEESKYQIVVAMKKSDYAEFRDVEFAYQVTGVRDGFENEKVIVNIDKLNVPETDAELAKNDVKKRIKALSQRMEQISDKKNAEAKEGKK
jgi:hypothetical protein